MLQVSQPDSARLTGTDAGSAFLIFTLAFCHMTAVASSQVLNILVEPLKRDLAISDAQIGLLQGFAFIFVASIVGVAVARYADAGRRLRVIAVGIAIWSAATVGCGLARSFEELFAARLALGVGEIFLFPAALSLIADAVPQERRVTAIALFGAGGPLGAGLALLGGGWLVTAVDAGGAWFLTPWRLSFYALGLLGLACLLLLSKLREPRSRSMGAGASWRALGDFARRHRLALGGSVVVCIAVTFAVNATLAWIPTHLIRTYRIDYATAGQITGVGAVIFAASGAALAGPLHNRLLRAGWSAAALSGAVAAMWVLAMFIALIVFSRAAEPPRIAVWLLYFFAAMPTVLGPAAIQRISPVESRASLMSVYMFLISVTAISFGPLSVGLLIDRVLGTDALVGMAILIVSVAATGIATLSLAISRSAFVRSADEVRRDEDAAGGAPEASATLAGR